MPTFFLRSVWHNSAFWCRCDYALLISCEKFFFCVAMKSPDQGLPENRVDLQKKAGCCRSFLKLQYVQSLPTTL